MEGILNTLNINTEVKEVQEFISDVLDNKKYNQESLDKLKKFNNDCYTLLKTYDPQTVLDIIMNDVKNKNNKENTITDTKELIKYRQIYSLGQLLSNLMSLKYIINEKK